MQTNQPQAPEPDGQGPTESQHETVLETRYLDLDRDGVPDAVQTVEAVVVEVGEAGSPNVVEVLEEVASDIGVDGVPEHVDVVDDVVVELQAVDG